MSVWQRSERPPWTAEAVVRRDINRSGCHVKRQETQYGKLTAWQANKVPELCCSAG
jgi:hypothetical protein